MKITKWGMGTQFSRRVSVVKKLLLIGLGLVLLGGGIAWKVMADKPKAFTGVVTPADASSFILPGGYQPAQDEQAWIDSHTGAPGAYVKKFGDYQFVLVTMGQKPSGGYSVEIAQVGVSGDKWVIDVRLISPQPGDIVIQVISFPCGYVKVQSDGKGFIVRDITGATPVEIALTSE
jgi:hypothetical protein